MLVVKNKWWYGGYDAYYRVMEDEINGLGGKRIIRWQNRKANQTGTTLQWAYRNDDEDKT